MNRGAVVATAGGTGEKETADYMEIVIERKGMQSVGQSACCISDDGLLDAGSPLFIEATNLGHSLVKAIADKKIFPDQAREQEHLREYFHSVMMRHRERWSWEYDDWKERGWL